MREIDILYTKVEVIIDQLNSYIIRDLRELKDPERESLTEAYDYLVQALACLNQSAFYRQARQPEVAEDEDQVCVSEGPCPSWIDLSKAIPSEPTNPTAFYTTEQKGEEVPEGTPIDNSNHTYFMGDERKFNWNIANAITHLTGKNTVNYDDFTTKLVGGEIIIRRKS